MYSTYSESGREKERERRGGREKREGEKRGGGREEYWVTYAPHAYRAVYLVQYIFSVGNSQVCVHYDLDASSCLIVVQFILAGLKGQETILPVEGLRVNNSEGSCIGY